MDVGIRYKTTDINVESLGKEGHGQERPCRTSPGPSAMDLHQLNKLQEGSAKSVVSTLGLVSTEYPEKIQLEVDMNLLLGGRSLIQRQNLDNQT